MSDGRGSGSTNNSGGIGGIAGSSSSSSGGGAGKLLGGSGAGGGGSGGADAGGGGAGGAAGPGHSVWGDLLCLGSAALYAGYTIVLRRALPDDDEADVALFFGYVGLFCTLLFAPLVLGLALSGAMDLSGVSREALGLILLQGVLNYAFSDYLWAHAVLLLGPTVATLGLSVQIPIAAAAEAAAGRAEWLARGATAAMTLGGTALILLGFFAGNLAGGGEAPPGHHRRGEAAAPEAAAGRPAALGGRRRGGRRSSGGGGGGDDDDDVWAAAAAGLGGISRGGSAAGGGSFAFAPPSAGGGAVSPAGLPHKQQQQHQHQQLHASPRAGGQASIEMTSSAASSPLVAPHASSSPGRHTGLLNGAGPHSSAPSWLAQQQQQQQQHEQQQHIPDRIPE